MAHAGANLIFPHLSLLGPPICVSLVLEPQPLPGATERIVGKPEGMAQIGSSGDYFRLARHSGTIRKVGIQASEAVQRDEKIASFFKFFSKGRAS